MSWKPWPEAHRAMKSKRRRQQQGDLQTEPWTMRLPHLVATTCGVKPRKLACGNWSAAGEYTQHHEMKSEPISSVVKPNVVLQRAPHSLFIYERTQSQRKIIEILQCMPKTQRSITPGHWMWICYIVGRVVVQLEIVWSRSSSHRQKCDTRLQAGHIWELNILQGFKNQ